MAAETSAHKASGEHCGGRREGPRPKQRFSWAYAHGRLDSLRPSCHPLTRPTLLAPTFHNTPSSFAKQRNAALLPHLHLLGRSRPPRSLFLVKQHRRGRTKIRTHAPQGLSVRQSISKPGLLRGHRSRFDTMQKDLGDNEVLRAGG